MSESEARPSGHASRTRATQSERGAGSPAEVILFWDIDLTLLSTARAGIFALEDAAREVLGADPDYSQLKTAGLTDSQIARMLMERHGVEESPETVGAFLRAYEARLPARLPERQGQVLDGVHEILDDLRDRPRVHSLLLTGNTQAGAAAKLAHYGLDGYFETGAFCMDMDDRDAIARRALDVAEAAIGEPPDLERTFVVGDTAHDITAGKAIGARTIAIASGVVSAEELMPHEPWLLWERLPAPEEFARALDLPDRSAPA
jgi:phosphoglycolate phosphatase-like HAD superfamily hydrolase